MFTLAALEYIAVQIMHDANRAVKGLVMSSDYRLVLGVKERAGSNAAVGAIIGKDPSTVSRWLAKGDGLRLDANDRGTLKAWLDGQPSDYHRGRKDAFEEVVRLVKGLLDRPPRLDADVDVPGLVERARQIVRAPEGTPQETVESKPPPPDHEPASARRRTGPG